MLIGSGYAPGFGKLDAGPGHKHAIRRVTDANGVAASEDGIPRIAGNRRYIACGTLAVGSLKFEGVFRCEKIGEPETATNGPTPRRRLDVLAT